MPYVNPLAMCPSCLGAERAGCCLLMAIMKRPCDFLVHIEFEIFG